MTHKDLVQLGAKWVKRNGFPVVATEIVTSWYFEIPDVIGFRSTCSVVVECKTSRADFLADARKLPRQGRVGSLGTYRFYLCPTDIISPNELPEKWGLLYATADARIAEAVKPKGNAWPGWGGAWERFEHESDLRAERAVLFSIARRARVAA